MDTQYPYCILPVCSTYLLNARKPGIFVFGDDVIQANGEINREKLGQIIFADSAKRKLLNSITHPEIYKSMLWKVMKAFFSGKEVN